MNTSANEALDDAKTIENVFQLSIAKCVWQLMPVACAIIVDKSAVLLINQLLLQGLTTVPNPLYLKIRRSGRGTYHSKSTLT